MIEFFEGSNVVRGVQGAITRDDRGMIDGVVHTPHGTVTISGHMESWRDQIVRFEMVCDGRLYYRWEHRWGRRILTKRGLKTYARRWAQSLVASHTEEGERK